MFIYTLENPKRKEFSSMLNGETTGKDLSFMQIERVHGARLLSVISNWGN